MSNMRWLPFVVLCSLAASQAPRPSGVIVGRVVDGIRNAPIAGALVTLTGAGQRKRVIVDAQGRFLFADLPAGSFNISASRSGFLDGTYGTLRPDGNGRTLDLQEGERVTDAVVRLWRSSTISGLVIDDAGDPVPNARVQVLKRTIVGGRWRLVNSNLGSYADETGMYRVTSLQPGDYALVMTTHTSSLPMSLLLAADATKRMTAPESSAYLRDLTTNGTAGYINDLSQKFAVVRVGEMMMQGSGAQINVSPDGRTVEMYPTVWYAGGASASEATIVSLGPGESRSGIDIRPTLTKMVRISGTVIGPTGPVPHLALRLVSARNDDTAAEITGSLALSLINGSASTDDRGAFTFLAVQPGQYIIRALTSPPRPVEPAAASTTLTGGDGMTSAISSGSAPPPLVTTEPTLWAAVPVSAGDTDTTGVSVVLRRGLRVTGRVEFDGTSPKPTGAVLRTVRLFMDPADGRTTGLASAYQAQIDPQGAFYTIGLTEGRYVLRVDTAPRGWTLKSAIVGGRDICDTPIALESEDVDGLVLTFTDHPSTVSGTVRDSQGRPDDGAIVLIFPSDTGWTNLGIIPRRLRSARASHSGAFSTTGLPPGDYHVVAINDAIAGNWQDPAFLQKLTRVATKMTLTDGQSVSLSLTTAAVQR